VKFGLGPYPADAAELYPELLDQVAAAEEEGFDSVWIDGGRQYSGGSPFPLGAAVARRTKAVRLGVMPTVGLVHPIYVAEDAAALDLISNGRLILGLADQPQLGSLEAYGVTAGDARARFWESVEVLYRAWAPEPFAHEGTYWKVPARLPEHTLAVDAVKVSVTPKPAQPLLPAWVAASNEESVRRAASRGLPVLGQAWETRSELAAKFDRYREAAGESLAGRLLPIIRDVHVAESTEQAWRDVEAPLAAAYGGYEDAGVLGNGADVRTRAESRAIVGDVDSVIDELEAYQAETGCNYVICRMALPGLSSGAVRSSMTLLGRGVAPQFRMFGLPPEIRARTVEEAGNPMIGYMRELS
jgi:alkanesulfonate monooxygenase SsuD/methylene tetrahydromethanopterin reductase-like flavin-dependent oxidoreductase (luciferase family)